MHKSIPLMVSAEGADGVDTKMTLIMTADFADQAYIENTEEYKILTRLKKDFPDLKIERKTHRTSAKSGEEYTHNQFKDLTYLL